MKHHTRTIKALRRVSLRIALPVASMMIALMMCLVFVAASVVAVGLRSDDLSRAETQRVAALLAPELAEGDLARVSDILETYAPASISVVDAAGNVIAGPESHPVFAQASAGMFEVRADKIVPAKLSMSLAGIVMLVSVACFAALLSGWFFAGHVQRSIIALNQVATDLRRRRARAETTPILANFVEFRQLHAAMRRAVFAIRRDTNALREQVYRDPVSGLPNMVALERALGGQLETVTYESPLGLLRLEVDAFDKACESVGSALTTQLRVAVIERISQATDSLRAAGAIGDKDSILAQSGMGTFVLMVPRISGRSEASTVARTLRSAFVAPLRLAGMEIRLGLSGGIAMAPEDGQTVDDLMRRSETALKSVRADDKGGFRFYAPRLDRVAKGRIQLEAEIREGIESGEFIPYFQPKIDFRTGRIRGCEALARWQRPSGRTVSPAAFIPVAEETGLIASIGEKILMASCEAAAGWLRQGLAMSVAVNVSPLQLRDPSFRDQVLAALSQAGLPPAYLELEITESVAIDDPDAFMEILTPLKSMGVRLAVDDFGTGHSNLAILSRLNFDVFKIDRQFVHALERDSSARPIVEMILAMAESLGLETVAEGVETPEHARFLRQRGCTYAQGFLYSPALTESDFLDFVGAWQARRQSRHIKQA